MENAALLLDSITDADASATGRIAVAGSHGGLYAAAVASRAGLRAVVLNDAGCGLNDAGIAGVRALADVGMAACAVDCITAEIGSARDMLDNGRISFANTAAADLGIATGATVRAALALLAAAPASTALLAPVPEARWEERIGRNDILCVDSASLICKGRDDERIIVTGSHGGLIGGDPSRACKAAARLVTFSDAGGGKNGIGFTRLPALDQRGVGALTISAQSMEIGSAASALETGIISEANDTARAMGVTPGTRLAQALASL